MYLNKLCEATSKYDILALSFSIIEKKKIKNFEYSERIIGLFNRVNEICNVESEMSFFNQLLKALMNEVGNGEFSNFDHIEIIKQIDNSYEDDQIPQLTGIMRKTKSLNRNIDKLNIYVLPKNHDTFLNYAMRDFPNVFRKKIESTGNSFLGIRNYIIFSKNDIKDFELSTLYYNDLFDIQRKVRKRKGLQISIAPTCYRDIETLLVKEIRGETFRFIGCNVIEEKLHSDRYKRILSELVNIDNDIIIFPELLLTPSLFADSKRIIQELKIEKKKIIVMGSSSFNGINECFVFDNSGHLIMSQKKKWPYILDGKTEELLDNNEVSILDIKGIGKILVLICADINSNDYDQLIKFYGVDIIILVSCTKSLDLKTNLEVYTRNNLCISIMANTCSAFYDDNNSVSSMINMKRKIGSISTPKTRDSERSVNTSFYKINKSCESCATQCLSRNVRIEAKVSKRKAEKMKIHEIGIVIT